MVDYGNGVGQVAGRAGGGDGGSGSMDVGVSIGHFVTNTVHTVSALPPAALLGLAIAIVLGLVFLRKAF